MPTKSNLKALFGQVKEAAEEIKNRIHGLDEQLDALFEERGIYLGSPLSKEDYMAAIRADVRGKTGQTSGG